MIKVLINILVILLTLIVSYFMVQILSCKLPFLFQRPSKCKHESKQYKLEVKKIKIINYVDKLILEANIRSNYINSKIIIFLCILILSISLITLYNRIYFAQNIITSSFLSILPIVVLQFLGEYVSNKNNASFIDFLNLLENFLEIRDDISFAIQKISEYEIGAITEYCKEYKFDITHGYTPTEALTNFNNKISNGQINNLIKTLISCEKYSGKYKVVVSKYKDNYIDIYEKLVERKKEAKKNRETLFIMIAGILLCLLILTFSNPNLSQQLFHTKTGNILLTILEANSMIAFFIGISIGKFKFN